jgi:phage RecT family recombinase
MNDQNSLAVYMRKPAVMERFEKLLNRDADAYVQSVLIAASASADLMKCTPESIFRSALRAASLGLSCDPALKQAWLVPYNKNVGTRENPQWVKEAQFQPHYKGLHTLAMRTGKYWQINVSPIYDGQRVLLNPLTGLHAVQENNGLTGEQPGARPGYIDVTNRRRKDMKVIGWLGYFKTKKGFEKSVWMSTEEIADHAEKYVKDYAKNPNWGDTEKRPTMEMKTVLRALLSWADMSGTENSQLAEVLREDEPIDAPAEDVAEPVSAMMTIEQARVVPVKGVRDGKSIPIGELPIDALNEICLSENTTDEQKKAAALVLLVDFNTEPPEKARRSPDEIKKELGY